jgi:hypothetical protein
MIYGFIEKVLVFVVKFIPRPFIVFETIVIDGFLDFLLSLFIVSI